MIIKRIVCLPIFIRISIRSWSLILKLFSLFYLHSMTHIRFIVPNLFMVYTFDYLLYLSLLKTFIYFRTFHLYLLRLWSFWFRISREHSNSNSLLNYRLIRSRTPIYRILDHLFYFFWFF